MCVCVCVCVQQNACPGSRQLISTVFHMRKDSHPTQSLNDNVCSKNITLSSPCSIITHTHTHTNHNNNNKILCDCVLYINCSENITRTITIMILGVGGTSMLLQQVASVS